MKFLKKFFSKIKRFWSRFVMGQASPAPTPALTPAPEPLDPGLIAQALDPLKDRLPVEGFKALTATCRTLNKTSEGVAVETDISKLARCVL